MSEIEEISKIVTAAADPNVNIFWGQVVDPDMGDKVSVTVIATGFNSDTRNETEDVAPTLQKPASNANSNVMSYGDFDSIRRGLNPSRNTMKPAAASFSSAMKTEMPSMVSSQRSVPEANMQTTTQIPPQMTTQIPQPTRSTGSLSGDLQASVERNGGLSATSTVAPQRTIVPEYDVDQKDFNQPAFWRQNLSRTIDLSGDK